MLFKEGKQNEKEKTRIFLAAVLIAALASQLLGAQATSTQNSGANVPTLAYNTLSDNEKIVYDYYNSINTGNWSTWASNYVPCVRQNYMDFATNTQNQQNNTGILTVNGARVLTIDKVDNVYAPKYRELEQFFSAEDTYECYMVGVDLTVNRDTEYYYGGINYKLILLVKENGSWGVGGECGCPAELLEQAADENLPVEEAVVDYIERSGAVVTNQNAGISTFGIGGGFISGSAREPANILVGLTDYCEPPHPYLYGYVNFDEFVRKGLSGEIGTMGYNTEAIRANAMAVKMMAWFSKLGHWRSAFGCDIIGGYDIAYNPQNSVPSSIGNAVTYIRNTRLVSSGGQYFSTNYKGQDYVGYKGCGMLSQNGSNNLAKQGYSWKDILHYYYDNSYYNSPNVGIIQFYSAEYK